MIETPRRSILLVEDEPLLAMDMERVLEAAGFHVIGPARSIALALRLLREQQPALAILDLNLGGEMVFPLLDALAESAIPFVVLSGHSAQMVPARHRNRPFLQKPYEPAALLRVVRKTLTGDGDRPSLKRA